MVAVGCFRTSHQHVNVRSGIRPIFQGLARGARRGGKSLRRVGRGGDEALSDVDRGRGGRVQGDGEGAVVWEDDGEEGCLLGKEGAGHGGARGHGGGAGLLLTQADNCGGGE